MLALVNSELLDKFFHCLHCACKKVTTKPFVLKFILGTFMMSLSGYNCQSVLILVSFGVVKCWQNTTVNDLIKSLCVHLILGLQAWTSNR